MYAYVSKHDSKREKQVILLTIPSGEKWHYLAVKIISALLRGITSKHFGNLHCSNQFHPIRWKNKFDFHKKVCENKDLCNVITPSEENKILEFNQYQKTDTTPFIVYVDLEFLVENIDGLGFLTSTTSLFKNIENKHYIHRSKAFMKKFCKSLREHVMKIIN